MIQSVDVNQLQMKELAKSISDLSGNLGIQLSDENSMFLLKKTEEFLGDSSRIMITDRKSKSDGYFLLDISKKGYRLLLSKSVSRSEYTYSFKSNVFKLNGRPIDQSFLVQFMNYFDKITNHIDDGNYEIIEESE